MLSLFIDYNKWHYSYALLNIFRSAREFVRFFFNLFSINLFLKSLFSPIFSTPVTDTTSEDITDAVAFFIGGIILRVVGAMFRTMLILLGLVFSIITLIMFSVIFVLWLILPLVFVALLYYFITFSYLLL